MKNTPEIRKITGPLAANLGHFRGISPLFFAANPNVISQKQQNSASSANGVFRLSNCAAKNNWPALNSLRHQAAQKHRACITVQLRENLIEL
jgi:hypothetical protein